MVPERQIEEAKRVKRTALVAILIQVACGSLTPESAADTIQEDWFPVFNVNSSGEMSVARTK